MSKKPVKQKIARNSKAINPHTEPFGQSAVREGKSRRPDSGDVTERDPGSLEEETLSKDAPFNKTYGVQRETGPRNEDRKPAHNRTGSQKTGRRQE
jgi:hypothetical protein